MVGEMMTANDEREDHQDRDELLRVAAQILAGQCAYRADTQEKNIPAIITAAENLICEVNARFETTRGDAPAPRYDQRRPPHQTLHDRPRICPP